MKALVLLLAMLASSSAFSSCGDSAEEAAHCDAIVAQIDEIEARMAAAGAAAKVKPAPAASGRDEQQVQRIYREQIQQHGAGGCTPNFATGGCL
jgi:hypothetical protein